MKKSGTIKAFNVSPKGFYEGFLLASGKRVVQINLPKDQGGSFDGMFKLNEEITVDIEAEEPRGTPEHEVYRLVSAGNNFSGTIQTLNYALHGEVNGGILDSGDFLHLKPAGARTVSLEVGMHVEGQGNRKPMVGGHSVIEAETVNGIAIAHHKAVKKHGPKHAHAH